MGFITALVVSLLLAVVGELIRPKVKPPNAKAASLDDFDFPTAEEGRSIPAFGGKVKITGANVTWYGDLEVLAIKKKVKTGWFSSTKQTIGNRYELGIQMAMAHGFSRGDVYCHEVLFGDKMPKHTRTAEAFGVTRFDFNDIDFYGGNEKEGGVQGTMRFYSGTSSQQASAYFAAQIGEEAPAYQNLVYAMCEQMYVGTSQYIKPISFILSSYPNQLGVPGGRHIIGEDANPACQIYELLTSKVWAVGLDPSDIDTDAFRLEADRWHSEGYGISMIYNGGSSAKDLIAEILRHVDAVMFSDPKTGLVTVRSARADYDVASLPVYGPDDFQEGIQFLRPSWSETKNTIKSNYVDRTRDYADTVVAMQDLSNIMQRGGEIETESIDFRGFTTYAACALATARSLKTMSYPLAKASGSLSRRAWATRPGDVFKLRWPQRGINDAIFRVVRVDYGNINQNLIGIDAVEDVFSISNIAYSEPEPSGWVNPVGETTALARQIALEAPMFVSGPEGALVMTMGSRANGIDLGYKVQTGSVSGSLTDSNSTDDFTSSAQTVAIYPKNTLAIDTTGFNITGVLLPSEIETAVDADDVRTGGTLLLLKSSTTEEWVAYGTINLTTGLVDDVYRGVLDTVMQEHPAGTQVWFLNSGYHMANDQPIVAGFPKNLYLKLLPFNVKGSLDPALATQLVAPMKGRYAAPFVPGRIRINSTRPDLLGTVTGAFTLTWAHRSRQDFEIVSQDATSRVPEAGATYSVIFTRTDTNAVLAQALLFDNSAAQASCDLLYTGQVRVQIFSTLNGIESYQRQDYTFMHSGGAANTITPNVAEYIIDGGEIT